MKTIQIPQDGGSDANLQFINAYEDEDGTIIFDAIRSSEGISGGNTQWPWASTLADFQSMTPKKSLWMNFVSPQ